MVRRLLIEVASLVMEHRLSSCIHITKYVQDLYVKIYKIMIEIKDLKKWKDIHYLWIGVLSIVKM